eukprot:scaffold651209_cov48-Prasinocladus_malaysianus.AAC.1
MYDSACLTLPVNADHICGRLQRHLLHGPGHVCPEGSPGDLGRGEDGLLAAHEGRLEALAPRPLPHIHRHPNLTQ